MHLFQNPARRRGYRKNNNTVKTGTAGLFLFKMQDMNVTGIAVALFDRRADEYRDKYMDVTQYAATLDLFSNKISRKGAAVLELACGPGNMTRYLLDIRPDLRILATDLSPKMLDLARAANPEAEFTLMDSREIKAMGRKFDAVFCGFLLPYLSKEEAIRLIADAAGVLEPGGGLYLSTMEDDYSRSGFQRSSSGYDELYMYYHEAEYLVRAMEDSGMKVLELQRISSLIGDMQVTDLVVIGVKEKKVTNRQAQPRQRPKAMRST